MTTYILSIAIAILITLGGVLMRAQQALEVRVEKLEERVVRLVTSRVDIESEIHMIQEELKFHERLILTLDERTSS